MKRLLNCTLILISVGSIFSFYVSGRVASQSGRVNNSNWIIQITNAANTTRNVNAKPTSISTYPAGSSRRQIVEQMFADGIVDPTATDMNDQPLTVDKLVKEITFRSADLNVDGTAEFIVEASNSMGLCGSGGCVSWIYQRKGSIWEQLMQEPTNGSISLRKTRTNGYFDIQLATQSGAYDQYFHTIKFDGRKYRENLCIEHNYIDANGNIMKRPKITKC